MKPFESTARLQFHKDFTMDHAAELVPYYAKLGVSHLYASPLLKSRPGSTHGYDIVDHNQIDPELGGEGSLRRLVAVLRAHDMGLVLDIVPNHMGVGGADNDWWLDVLEWGRASAYAEFFDIDWDRPDASLRSRMLAPFLGSPYGDCLANGEITLQFDPGDGRFFAGYYSHRFPISPRDYPSILLTEGGPLEEAARAFGELSTTSRDAMRRDAAAARKALLSPDCTQAIAACLAAYAPAGEAGGTACTACWNGNPTACHGGAPRRTRSTGAASSTSTDWPASGSKFPPSSTPRIAPSCACMRKG